MPKLGLLVFTTVTTWVHCWVAPQEFGELPGLRDHLRATAVGDRREGVEGVTATVGGAVDKVGLHGGRVEAPG